MTTAEAFELLNLDATTASAAAVKAAFRATVLAHHPDRGGDPKAFIASDFTEAKALALEAISARPCASCGGTGKVHQTLGFFSTHFPCAVCGGSGKSPPEEP